MMPFLPVLLLLPLVLAREITFPPVSGYQHPLHGPGTGTGLGSFDTLGAGGAFAGLTTFANLPYVHCLGDQNAGAERFDVAFLGAPFDTVSLPTRMLAWCSTSHWEVIKNVRVACA